MPSPIAVIRDSIESDYRDFQGMDSDGPYRLAGRGRSGFASLYRADNGTVRISWEADRMDLEIEKGLFEGPHESIPFGRGKMHVTGDLAPTSVFNRDVYLFTRDALLKAIAESYSHRARFTTPGKEKSAVEKEFWSTMLLNYAKRGKFEPDSHFWFARRHVEFRMDDKENEDLKKAVQSARALRLVWTLAGNYNYAVAMSSVPPEPFYLAKPDALEFEGEFSFSFEPQRQWRKRNIPYYRPRTKGKLSLVSGDCTRPFDYSVFRLPCLARAEYCQIPNEKNDIARTDGIRKRKPTILKGRDVELYVEDVGRAHIPIDYRDLGKQMLRGSPYLLSAAGFGIVGGAVLSGVGAALISGVSEVTSWTGWYDWNWWENARTYFNVSAPFAIIGLTALGGFLGLLIIKESIVPVRKVKGDPKMDYWIRAEEPTAPLP